jgi:glycosyltransferase involved in cell wall biosynthesis
MHKSNYPPTSLRVCICTPSFAPQGNGIAIGASILASGLSMRGHELLVVTQKCKNHHEDSVWQGIPIHRLATKGKGTFLGTLSGEIAKFHQLLFSIDADVLVFVCWETWFVHAAEPILGRLRGVKILDSHGTSVHWQAPGLKGWLRRLAYLPHIKHYPRLLPKFDHLVVLTALERRDRFYDLIVAKQLGYQSYSVIPNGADLTLRRGDGEYFRSRYGLGDDQILLYVANFYWLKNHRHLIQEFLELDTAKPLSLVLIGSEGDSDGVIEQAIHRANTPNRRILVLKTLTRQEIADAYCSADVYACPSLTEAQPLSILDAMGVGLPFVAYDVGSVAEFPGGIVIESGTSMKSALTSLLNDKEIRSELSSAGRRAAAEYFNWDRTVSEYCALIGRLVAGKARLAT